MSSSGPTRDQLTLLESKYAEILALRQARDRGEPMPEKHVFKALAERFPGVLRELDTLPLEVVENRLLALRAAGVDGPIEPWMAWMSAYHALVRVALSIKLRTAKRQELSPDRLIFLARTAGTEVGFGVDEQFVMEVARPRAGRINAVVMARLETMFGVPEMEIRKALFPGR